MQDFTTLSYRNIKFTNMQSKVLAIVLVLAIVCTMMSTALGTLNFRICSGSSFCYSCCSDSGMDMDSDASFDVGDCVCSM